MKFLIKPFWYIVFFVHNEIAVWVVHKEQGVNTKFFEKYFSVFFVLDLRNFVHVGVLAVRLKML